jgi:hypothetical protein
MKAPTYFIAFRPSGGLAHAFATYQEAWRFAEEQLAAGLGVWFVEKVDN